MTRDRVAGVVERIDSTGKVLVELDEEALRESVRALVADGCDAFAVCLLWSIQNPDHERRVREIASRAVAHLKRGDGVTIRTNAGGAARADRTAGADPVLRYLALIEPVATRPRADAAPEAAQ